MKKLLLLISTVSSSVLYAQVDTANASFKLDLLKAPSSPASNLLGFAVSDIDKPTDVSDFMLSLRSATNGFASLPKNYAIDIAPFLLFAKENSDTKKMLSNASSTFKQTLVLSLGYKNPDSTETELNQSSAYGGFGFKFSIVRGKYDSRTNRALNKLNATKLYAMHNIRLEMLNTLQQRMDADPELIELIKKRNKLTEGKTPAEINDINTTYQKKINDKYEELRNVISKELRDSIQEKYDDTLKLIASSFQVERIGWSLDAAGGISGEFVNKTFDKGQIHKAGFWLSGGYTGKTGVSFLGLARFLHNPNQVLPKDTVTQIATTTNWDAGGRLIYSKPQSKFSASVEYISRWSSADVVGRTWRLLFNADYALWDNQKLTFSFGRNFDGTINKDGNLVAALSFLTGFGNKRN